MFPFPRRLSARMASSSGSCLCQGTEFSSAQEIVSFWQNGQRRLQPKLPIERIRLPG